jgi:hypothetical protein
LSTNAQPALPREVEGYVLELERVLRSILERELVGLYLIGSIALNDYIHGRSDVDVLAIASRAPEPPTSREIVERIAHPNLPCPARGLEFVLYERDAVGSRTRGSAFSINLNSGPHMRTSVSFDPTSEPAHWFLIDRSIARDHALLITGPPPSELFARIPRAWTLDALRESLAWHRQNESGRPNTILNACRAWLFAKKNLWASKSDAAAWARQQLDDPTPVETALRGRAGGDPARVDNAEVVLARVEDALLAASNGS